MKREPDWIEKTKRLLLLLGRIVSLVGQVMTLYSKFRN